MGSELQERTNEGRRFQTLGAAELKEQLPATSLVPGSYRKCKPCERSIRVSEAIGMQRWTNWGRIDRKGDLNSKFWSHCVDGQVASEDRREVEKQMMQISSWQQCKQDYLENPEIHLSATQQRISLIKERWNYSHANRLSLVQGKMRSGVEEWTKLKRHDL